MADIQALHEKASQAMIEGNKEKALELYNNLLTENPADEIAMGQLMDIYFDTDKFKYYLMRANYNISAQKYEHAINDTKKALGLEPDSIEARTKLARLYKVSKKNLKAIDEFCKIVEHNPDNENAYYELIELYITEDAQESAVNIAKKAVEQFENNTNFKNVAAKLYFDLGDYNNALNFVEDNMLKIKILLGNSDNEEAKKILDSHNINKNDKEALAAYYLLLAEYFYNTNNSNEALNAISEYVKIKGPDAISFQMKALVYEQLDDEFQASYNWAFMNKSRGKLDEAVVEFSHCFNLNQKNKDVLVELAGIYMQMNEKYTAMDFWQRIYELDGDTNAKEVLGEFYFKEGDYAMAEKYGKYKEQKNAAQKSYNGPKEEDEGLLNKIINIFSKK